MVVIKFICENGYYKLFERKPDTALLLSLFLTSDVTSSAQTYLKFFESDEDDEGAMNATQYNKTDGIVTITPEWVIDEDESIAKGNYFRISSDVLADLLRQWDVVYKQKPTYITITIDGDDVSVVGSDTIVDARDAQS